MKNWVKLILCIIAIELVGVIGGFFTASSIPLWYDSLIKPSFNPPNWIFGPVWTILYITIGISLYLVWTNKAKSKKKTKFYWAFWIQLILNFFWSILFFGNQNIFGALIEIIFLWMAILATIIFAYKISKPSAYLLIPYWLWVSFATVLNFAIWILN